MKISTESYDIMSLLGAYAAKRQSTPDTTTSAEESSAASAVNTLMRRMAPPEMGESPMSLSPSGQKVKDSIQHPEPPSEEMKAVMDQVRSSFESLESTDVDSLSDEDAKAMLEEIAASMAQLPLNQGNALSAGTSSAIDVESYSSDEIKDILQGLQDRLKEGPRMNGNRPPMPPGQMMGFDPASILGSEDEEEEDTADAATAKTELAQQLVDILSESFDNSEETRSDYATRLKDSIAELLEKRKTELEDFASTLYTQLDAWSNTP